MHSDQFVLLNSLDKEVKSIKELEYRFRNQCPVVFDVFHHFLNNNGESTKEGVIFAQKTYQKRWYFNS